LQIVKAKTFGDFQAMHPRIHVGRDERDAWSATLAAWGWDALHAGYQELVPTLTQKTHRVLLGMLTAWLDEHYELTGS
jgi:hypothetical protein